MPKQVDILFASHMYQLIGGAERALYDEVTYLKKIGLSVHVIVGAEDSFSKALKKAGISYTHIDLAWWAHASHDSSPYIYSHPDVTHSSVAKTVQLIQTLQPRLCVTNTIVLPWLAYAAAMTNTPHAWQIHEMGHIHHLQYDIGSDATFATINAFSNIVFYNSQATADYYKSFILPEKNGGLIYPIGPVDKKLNQSVTSPFRPESLKLVTVGQIKEQKRQLDCIKIVHRLLEQKIETEIAIIGIMEDKQYVDEITSYINDHNLSHHVHLMGFRDEPSAYVAHADIALICAEKEAFGRVTVEAMLLGKPVVGAASGGTLEIIDDTKTGFLFEPGDVARATEIIRSLYNSPTTRRQIGQSAKLNAEARFSQDEVYAPLIKYLKKIEHTSTDSAINLSPLSSVVSDHIQLINDYKNQQERIVTLENELSLIRNSRSWKLASQARKMRHLGKRS